MNSLLKRHTALISFAILAACATQGPPPDACIGNVVTPPVGLVATTDDALLQKAIGAPTKGALCKGQVFIAEKEVTVYRVWDASKSYTLYGSWWSFSLPEGPRDRYRVENDICPEWSPLDKMSSCTLKMGTKIVVGPGQSAQCAVALMPASAVNQVYVPNDSRNNVLYVEHCNEGTDWPATGK